MTTEAKWSDFTSLDVGRTANAASQLLPPWVALLLVTFANTAFELMFVLYNAFLPEISSAETMRPGLP